MLSLALLNMLQQKCFCQAAVPPSLSGGKNFVVLRQITEAAFNKKFKEHFEGNQVPSPTSHWSSAFYVTSLNHRSHQLCISLMFPPHTNRKEQAILLTDMKFTVGICQ